MATTEKLYLFKLLVNSLSFSIEDKVRIVNQLQTLSKKEIEELLKILEKELRQFKSKLTDNEEETNQLFENNKDSIMNKLFIHETFIGNPKEINLNILNEVSLPSKIIIDKLFLIKLVINSCSLSDIEKDLIINNLSKLNQFNVNDLIRILVEEIEKFNSLDEEHHSQLNELLNKYQNKTFNLFVEKKPILLNSISPYGVKNMVGNGHEMTIKNDKEILKGNVIDFNFKNSLKGKYYSMNEFKTAIFDNYTTFRCVKPIFSLEDLEGTVINSVVVPSSLNLMITQFYKIKEYFNISLK